MIRSIAYNRYFSTATPTHTGSTPSPSVPATCQYDEESPEASALIAPETTSATAPLYSHLSCWRRSPADLRYFGTWAISHTRQPVPMPTTSTFSATSHHPEALAATLPLAFTGIACLATATKSPTDATTLSTEPAAMSVTATRRHRPCGSRPSGNSHSRSGMRNSQTGHPTASATATRPSGSVPWRIP
jgi:hypothetical protein